MCFYTLWGALLKLRQGNRNLFCRYVCSRGFCALSKAGVLAVAIAVRM